MTIQRKNLLSSGPLLATYGFLIVFGYAVNFYEMVRIGWPLYFAANSIGNIAAVLRMSGSWVGKNKYLMWILIGGLTHVTRHTFMGDTPLYLPWFGAFVVTFGAVGWVGYFKLTKKYYAKTENGFC